MNIDDFIKNKDMLLRYLDNRIELWNKVHKIIKDLSKYIFIDDMINVKEVYWYRLILSLAVLVLNLTLFFFCKYYISHEIFIKDFELFINSLQIITIVLVIFLSIYILYIVLTEAEYTEKLKSKYEENREKKILKNFIKNYELIQTDFAKLTKYLSIAKNELIIPRSYNNLNSLIKLRKYMTNSNISTLDECIELLNKEQNSYDTSSGNMEDIDEVEFTISIIEEKIEYLRNKI